MKATATPDLMWTMFLHLGSNMWSKKGERERFAQDTLPYHDTMHCDKEVFHEITEYIAENGINTVVINIGEGLLLDSHPEIAVEGAWTKDELKVELDRLHKMGVKTFPKYNFSCAHNAWMQDHGFEVNTPQYHQFCRDIIKEVIEVFDKPEFFHLGLNDENGENQEYFPVAIVRGPKAFAEDAKVLFDACLENGVRPWIWCDVTVLESFGGFDKFCENVPKSVLVSNLYMGNVSVNFPDAKPEDQRKSLVHMPPSTIYRNKEKTLLYNRLEEAGYDQIPTGSACLIRSNVQQTMTYCNNTLKNKEKILGYASYPLLLTDKDNVYGLMFEVDMFKAGKASLLADGRKVTDM